MQEHAYLSISITSQLSRFLRPPGQQRTQGKLFQMVTIDQLQVPWTGAWGRMGTRLSLPNLLDFLIFFLLIPLIPFHP